MPNNEHTTSFKVDISQLQKGIQDANRQIRLANAEFKAASSSMEDWGSSADGLSAKIKQLDTVLSAETKKLDSLEKQLAATEKEYGSNSKAADELRIKIANQQATINKTERSLNQYKSELDNVERGLDDVSDASKEAEKDSKNLGDGFTVLKGTMASLIADGVKSLISGLGSLVSESRETIAQMGKLETAFASSGFSAETAKQTYEKFYGVLGDEGQATEAVAFLGKMVDSEKDLTTWTNIATGVYAEFGAALPIESLTEAANETQKTGQITGALADALNWAGISEEEFQSKLDACSSEQERQKLIMDTLNSTYSDSAEKYKEVNGDLIENQEATASLSNIMAEFGQVVMPIITTFAEAITGLLKTVLPGFQQIGEGIKGLMNDTEGGAEQLKNGVQSVFNGLISQITSVLPNILSTGTEIITTLIEGIVEALPGLITAIVQAIPGMIDNIVTAFKKIVEMLPDIIKAIVDALPTLIPAIINGIVEMIVTLCENFASIIQPIIDALPGIIISIVQAIVDNLPALIQGIIQLILGIVQAIPKIIQALIDALPTVISLLTQALLNNLPAIIMGLIQVVLGIVKSLPQIFMSLIQAIPAALSGIWDGLANVFGNVGEWFGNIFGGAWDAIKNVFSGAGEWFSGIWDAIKNAFSKVGTWFKDIFKKGWDNITGIFKKAGSWFKDTVIKPVQNFFTGMWDGLKNGAANAWNGITGIFSKVASFFGDIFSAAWQKVKGVFSAGGKIFDGIKDGIVNAFKKVVNAIITGINKVVALPFKGLNALLDKIQGVTILDFQPFSFVTWRAPIPEIPYLAKGGVLKKGQVGFLEGDGAEAVVPLEKNTKWLDKIAERLSAKILGLNGTTLLNPVNTLTGITSPYNQFKTNVGMVIPRAIADGIKLTAIDALNAIVEMNDGMLLSEQVYFREKERLEKEKADKEYAEKIANAKDAAEIEKIKQEQINKAAEEAQQQYLDNLKAKADKEREIYEGIIQQQNSLSQSLYDEIETPFKTVEILRGSADGEVVDSFYKLTDMTKENKTLEEYSSLIDELISKRGEMVADVQNNLAGMSIEEGIQYVRAMLDATDDEWNSYISSFAKRQSLTDKIAKAIFPVNEIVSNFTFDTLSETAGVAWDCIKDTFDEMTPYFDTVCGNLKDAFIDATDKIGTAVSDVATNSMAKLGEVVGKIKQMLGVTNSGIALQSVTGAALQLNANANGVNSASGVVEVSNITNFYQTNNSPKALSRLELYRMTKNQLNAAKGV